MLASTHQPSSTLRFSTPFIAAFMPLVPDASSGGSGVLSQTSAPATKRPRQLHVVVGEEHDRQSPAQGGGCSLQVEDALACPRHRADAPCRPARSGTDDRAVYRQQPLEIGEQQLGRL